MASIKNFSMAKILWRLIFSFLTSKVSDHFIIILCISFAVILTGCGRHTSILSFGGVEVLAPVPQGFNPVSTVAPPFFAYMNTKESPLSILIEYYITDKDLKDVLAGHSKSRGQTLAISTTRVGLFRDYSENSFQADASEIRNDAARDVAQAKIFKSRPAKIVSERLTTGLPSNATPFGVFFDQRDGIGTFISQEFHTPDGIVKRIDAGIRIRVRQRSVDLVCSSKVKSEADSLEIRRICSDWAVSILRANA